MCCKDRAASSALARRRFAGRALLVRLLAAPFLLPVVVAVLGLLAVFGRAGPVNAALTGLGLQPVLRASHISPWSDDPENRLNPSNGILLAATYDAAFDQHLLKLQGLGVQLHHVGPSAHARGRTG